jgi:hypothetical protein
MRGSKRNVYFSKLELELNDTMERFDLACKRRLNIFQETVDVKLNCVR